MDSIIIAMLLITSGFVLMVMSLGILMLFKGE